VEDPAPPPAPPPATAGGGDDGLGDVVRSGLRWSLGTQLVLRLVSFVAGILVFRLLGPTDFGVYALALAVSNIALCVNDLGQDIAVLNWGDDVEEVQGTAMTLAMGTSVLVFLGCWALAPTIADSAGQPGAVAILRAASSLVLIDGLIAVPRSGLYRSLDQRRISVSELVAAPVNVGLSVGLALAWPGPWGPLIGTLASALVNAAFTLRYAPAIPRPAFDLGHARRLARVGVPGAGTMTVEMALLNVDTLIVANRLGATALGFYALAFNISSWPSTIITNGVRKVSMAALNRLVQSGADWRAAFSRSMSLLLALLVPICLLLGTLAAPLVEFLYTADSLAAVSVLRWLVLLGGARVALGFVMDLMVAHRRTDLTLRAELLWLVAAVPALWVGAGVDGVRGVAIGHVLAALLVATPAFLWEAHRLGAPLRPVAAKLARPLLGTATGALVAWALLGLFAVPFVELVVVGPVVAVVYALVAVPRAQLVGFAQQARGRALALRPERRRLGPPAA
jgi:O-antigen/teichoic acid export membrane protein